MTSRLPSALRASPPGADARIAAAAKGDRGAAQSLMLELLPRVRNLVRYLVRGERGLDDATQEALVAILKGLPTYRGDGPFTAWCDRVVARATFATILRRPREPSPETEPPIVPTPSERYAARVDLARHLDRMPYEQRHALVLHHVLGMSVPEIARETSSHDETVRSRLRLGMERLRALQNATSPRSAS